MERYLRKSLSNLYRWTLMALAETALVTPWLVILYRSISLQAWARALPGSWLLILAFLVGALWESGRPKAEGKDREFRSRVAGMAGGSVLFYSLAYFALPADLRTGLLHGNMAWVALPAIWYVWYQAAETVTQGLEYGRVYGRFTRQAIGMALGVLLVLVTGLAHEPRVQVMLYWDVFMLFGAGLTLLLVARERSLKKGQAALGEAGAGGESFSRRLTILVAVLLGVTLIASQIVSPEQLSGWVTAVGQSLKAPLNWLLDVVMLIVIRWAAMIYALLSLLRRVFARGTQPPPPEKQDGPPPKQPFPDELMKEVQGADWTPYIKVGLVVLAAAVVLVWLYRLQRRRQAEMGGQADEERVSLGFWAGLLADLRLWLANLRRKEPAPEVAVASAGGPPADPRDPRALYRRLQGWGLGHGRGRKRSETPSQYEQALTEAVPEAGAAAEAVTAVYNQARYGPRPPEPDAVAAAATNLEQLQKQPLP